MANEIATASTRPRRKKNNAKATTRVIIIFFATSTQEAAGTHLLLAGHDPLRVRFALERFAIARGAFLVAASTTDVSGRVDRRLPGGAAYLHGEESAG